MGGQVRNRTDRVVKPWLELQNQTTPTGESEDNFSSMLQDAVIGALLLGSETLARMLHSST